MRRPMLPKTQGLHPGSLAARRPRHTRPSLEALEGRQLLTDGVLLQAGLTYSWDAIKQTETAAELARLDDPDAALQITQNFGQGQDAVDSQEEQQAGPAETSVVGPMWSQMLDDIQQARPLIEQASQLEQQEIPLPAEQRRPLEDQAQQLVAQAEQLIGQAEQDWYNAQDDVLTSQQGQPAPAPQSPPVTVPTIPQSPSNPQPVPSNPTPTTSTTTQPGTSGPAPVQVQPPDQNYVPTPFPSVPARDGRFGSRTFNATIDKEAQRAANELVHQANKGIAALDKARQFLQQPGKVQGRAIENASRQGVNNVGRAINAIRNKPAGVAKNIADEIRNTPGQILDGLAKDQNPAATGVDKAVSKLGSLLQGALSSSVSSKALPRGPLKAINAARGNGSSAGQYAVRNGNRALTANIDHVLGHLQGAASGNQIGVRRDAKNLLAQMAQQKWRVTAGPHFSASDPGTKHITLSIDGIRGQYHLRLNGKGQLFQITHRQGTGLSGIPPWASPGR